MLSRLALIATTASTASIAADHLLRTAIRPNEDRAPATIGALAAAGKVLNPSISLNNGTWYQLVLMFSSFAGRPPLWSLKCASCDGQTTLPSNDTPPAQEEEEETSFPNLSRHGSSSSLAKYLTREIYDQLKDRKTSMGVTLEDTIRAGATLPWGANPPRGIAGVYAGDAESYQVFRPLFDPLILERHHVDTQREYPRNVQPPASPGQKTLQRHRTNLNPQFLVQQRLDLDGEYVLYTRMRLARSLEGFRFSPCITRAERRKIEKILRDCCEDWKEGSYMPIMEMSNEMHDDLIQRGYVLKYLPFGSKVACFAFLC